MRAIGSRAENEELVFPLLQSSLETERKEKEMVKTILKP